MLLIPVIHAYFDHTRVDERAFGPLPVADSYRPVAFASITSSIGERVDVIEVLTFVPGVVHRQSFRSAFGGFHWCDPCLASSVSFLLLTAIARVLICRNRGAVSAYFVGRHALEGVSRTRDFVRSRELRGQIRLRSGASPVLRVRVGVNGLLHPETKYIIT
jgi:hypothetical protein